ncbi:MAG: galactose mutarotase [Ferrovibrio sp.]|uniref:aldose epimerase family protein n=1 Tax=Ferrovibrio sp. TaxID=1917215 RepID=UPI002620161F|nr:aldose epimerase family protein [Ferrovibrio sp.]MCW0233027.1 galactose mutarotase [Ferrovibrio sp.]
MTRTGYAIRPDAVQPVLRADYRGTVDGRAVDLFTLTNARGMTVRATNWGARLVQIVVPDRDGRPGDVALGYDTLAEARAGQPSMGAFIGRYANRIAEGRLVLDGQLHQLSRNDGPNHIHGGSTGSRFAVFDASQPDAATLRLRYRYADGQDGYPGNLDSEVDYHVSPANELVIRYRARTDRTTVVNFTSHVFFNLRGDAGDILDHSLTVHADATTPVDPSMLPTGEIRPVRGTPFDFTQPMAVGAHIDDVDMQLVQADGYDVNYVLRDWDGSLKQAARLADPASGRVMEVFTTAPGLQLYTGNHLAGAVPRDRGKGGRVYARRHGLCLEPQHFPDSPNQPHFPGTVLEAGAEYAGCIVYRFSVDRIAS